MEKNDFFIFSLSKSAEIKRLRVQPSSAGDEVPAAMEQRPLSTQPVPGICLWPNRVAWAPPSWAPALLPWVGKLVQQHGEHREVAFPLLGFYSQSHLVNEDLCPQRQQVVLTGDGRSLTKPIRATSHLGEQNRGPNVRCRPLSLTPTREHTEEAACLAIILNKH